MATTRLFFNISTERFVRSVEDPRPIDTAGGIPRWFYGDVKSLEVTFVEAVEVDKVQVVQTFTSVQVAVGIVGSSPATNATAGTPNAAFAYPITLPLNLAAVSNLISNSAPTVRTLEFRVVDVVGPNRYQTSIYIAPQLMSDTVADPVAPEVALSRNEAAGIYIPKEWPAGMRMIAVTDSGRRFLFYPRDDGTFSGDEI